MKEFMFNYSIFYKRLKQKKLPAPSPIINNISVFSGYYEIERDDKKFESKIR